LPSSSKFVFEREHKVDVSDPLQITIGAPRNTKDRVVDFPKVPTLYQVANVAFPRKWIWRRSRRRDWTEEQLKNVELDEVRHKRGWWANYGPGRGQA
jgi:hypothetical protein